jgi:hypothetical protein
LHLKRAPPKVMKAVAIAGQWLPRALCCRCPPSAILPPPSQFVLSRYTMTAGRGRGEN